MSARTLTYPEQQAYWLLRAAGPQAASEVATRMGWPMGPTLRILLGLRIAGLVQVAVLPTASLWWLTPPVPDEEV